jgi:hypothetical protein
MRKHEHALGAQEAHTSSKSHHEHALGTQGAHTSSKSHYELNIRQRIPLLKVRLLKMRIIQQVPKLVSKEIKGLIQVVSTIFDEVVNF